MTDEVKKKKALATTFQPDEVIAVDAMMRAIDARNWQLLDRIARSDALLKARRKIVNMKLRHEESAS